MKKFLVLFLLISCQTHKPHIQDPSTGVTKTSIHLKDSYLNLFLEVYHSPTETYGYLISKDFLLEPKNKKISLKVNLEDQDYKLTCPVHVGNQKISLPNIVVKKIMDSFKEKKRILIALEDEIAIIENIEQISKPLYEEIVERGFDYLDKNVYQ